MSNINMSLDEIIAATKTHEKPRGVLKSFKNGKVRSSKFNVRKIGMKAGFKKRAVTHAKPVRSDRWQHDKFEGAQVKTASSGRWQHDKFDGSLTPPTLLSPSSNVNKKVRLNISNLAATVTTADLKELFTPYSFDSASVHYGQDGVHLGTGEVTLKKSDAQKAINELKGIAIDGLAVRFAIVEGESIFSRVQMVKKVVGGGIQKRARVAVPQKKFAKKPASTRHPLDRTEEDESPKVVRSKGGRIAKKPKTEAELDAELDSYMKKN